MKLHLDRSLKTPLYLQIRSQIRQLILANELLPDTASHLSANLPPL